MLVDVNQTITTIMIRTNRLVQCNLSNPTHQWTREMCRIVRMSENSGLILVNRNTSETQTTFLIPNVCQDFGERQ
jgi:hypothetical protein